ncbi:hypothetical protein TSUD_288140 [Trifolium subterraneum]|uniref:Uncharacterized protein n=1 Tax=Trifolium subterraneum TaxID=3900 RepID=A0A2Z6N8N1_TRISU|nr:hypothetical protein TSUD_288140 [Trifolium subterraneum]
MVYQCHVKKYSSDRAIWIRLYGVPIHAWRETFFRKVLELTGEVIVQDEDTCKKRRLDFARVLVRTSSLSFIIQVEKVMIDGDFYVIRLLEEVNPCPISVVKHQNPQHSDDEDSNGQWWINQNLEEEEEGEVNSQNLEREYNAFNEYWEEKGDNESGGANRETQGKSLNSVISNKAVTVNGEIRERIDQLISSAEDGSHFITKDPLFLESIGVVFTGALGSTQRPKLVDLYGAKSGNGSPTQTRCSQSSAMLDAGNVESESKGDQHQTQINALSQENTSDEEQTLQQGRFENHRHQSDDDSLTVNPLNPLRNRSGQPKKTIAVGVTSENKRQKAGDLEKKRRRRIIPKMKDLARAKAKKMNKKKTKQVKLSSVSKEGSESSKSLNQVNMSFGSSCSGEISEWRKWVLLHEDSSVVASKVWEFGRKEGVTHSGDEDGVVKELEGIENRDRVKSRANLEKGTQGCRHK